MYKRKKLLHCEVIVCGCVNMNNQLQVAVLCLLMCVVNMSKVHTRKHSVRMTYYDKDVLINLHKITCLHEDLGSSCDDGGDAPGPYYDATYRGEPLFLTPYIERGDIKEAQQAALVEPYYGNIISYSGFFTVNKEYNSNMYFWFFPAERDSETAPLVLCLPGGPGSSGMIALFEEHGPFYLSKNLKLKPRKYYWTKTMNVIYIDNPIGTGFSFTNNEQGYSTNENDVGENLYNAVTQFFQLFPQFVKNDFYICGISYGGKFAAALAYVIDKNNLHLSNSDKKINLKGISIGNGFCDPINMVVNLSNYLYQIGLLDLKTKLVMEQLQGKLIVTIQEKKYLEGIEMLTNIYEFISEKSGFQYFFNYLFTKKTILHGNLGHFFENPKIRKNLHVGKLTYHNASIVQQYLTLDIMKSVKPWIENLIEKYKILLYTGQLDILVAYPATLSFIRSLDWSGVEYYTSAERKLWYVDNDVAGYKKTVKNFTEVLMRNAGHITAIDQPKWTFDLIDKFTHNLL